MRISQPSAHSFLPAVPATAVHGRRGLLRTTALQPLVMLAFALPALTEFAVSSPALAQPVPSARPVGGMVVGGTASIGQTATTTTVTQSTQRAAIDWRGFDVGAGHTVTFQQPGATSVVLNRVTGPDPSQIAGTIRANGQVVITNQSGVVFHKGSQVDTAGLVVSAAGISTSNFMAGRMVFDQAPKPDAMVSNAGTITIRQAGLAALVAPQVANSGVIQARMGRAVLAGAETHTVDLYGDGLLSIDVTGQVRRAPLGADGKPVTALVTNTGTILADGGSVQLTATAADGIVQTLVQSGGRLQANAADGRPGTVLVAGVGGSVRMEGMVAADGGGTVSASSNGMVTVAESARIRANGTPEAPGGGTIRIGTKNATATAVKAGATVSANGRGKGDGGRITVLSGGTTQFDGSLSARGGRDSGNGGAVEISGRIVGLTGTVDAGAPRGKQGTVLLDPTDVTISDHGGSGTVVTPASLQAAQGDVTVQADNSIVADSSVILSGQFQELTLTAGNSVQINAGVTLASTNGYITINAGNGGISALGNLTLRFTLNMTAVGPITQGPQSRFEAAQRIALSSRTSVDLQGALSTRSLDFSVAGAVTQGLGGAISATEVSGTVGSLSLTSRANQISAIGGLGDGFDDRLSATTGDIAIVTSGGQLQAGYFASGVIVPDGHAISLTTDALTLIQNQYSPNVITAPNGTVTLQPFTAGRQLQLVSDTTLQDANTLSLRQADLNRIATGTLRLQTSGGGAITLGDAVNAISLSGHANTLDVVSTGAVSQAPTASLNVPVLTGTAGSVTLPGDNAIGALGALTTAGALTVNNAAALTVTGPVNAGGAATLSTTAAAGITVAGDLGAPSLTLTAGPRGGSTPVREGVLQISRGSPNPPSFSIVQTAGTVTVPGSATFTADGDITQSGGRMILGSLSGTSGGTLNLASPTNAIAALNGFTAGGAVAVANGSSLAVNGPLSANAIRLDVTGNMALASTLAASTVTLNATGALTQPAGSIAATTLTGTAGSATLGQTGNTITNLGPFAATSGDFKLSTTSDLTVAGAVSAAAGQTLTLSATSLAFGANGSLAAPGGTVAIEPLLPGTPFTIGGLTTAITADTLRLGRPDTGSLTLTNSLNLPDVGTLSLVTAGGVTEVSEASITVPRLTVTGTTISLGGANAVGTLGDASASGPFTFVDTLPLLIAGAVTAGGNIALSAPGLTLGTAFTPGTLSTPAQVALVAGTGTINEPNGSITAGSLTGNAAAMVLGGANRIGVLAGYEAGPGELLFNDLVPLTVATPLVGATAVTLQSTDSLTLAAPVTAGTLTLNAPSVVQTSGAVTAGTLNLTAANVTLTGAVGTLGAVQVPGTFRLVDTADALATSGPMNVGTLDLTANRVTFGPLTAGTLRLATGSVEQSGGILQIGTLTGTSTGTVALGTGPGTVFVQVLSDFTAAQAIGLADSGGLTVAGVIGAPLLALRSPSLLTLQGGTVQARDISLVAAGIAQTGTTYLQPLAADVVPVTLAAQGGTITLNNLVAPDALLTLNSQGGSATGNLTVRSLFVVNGGGSALLFGSVGGRTGPAAATVANISLIEPSYTLNGCVIGISNCTALLVQPNLLRPDITLTQSFLRPRLFVADLIGVDIARTPTDPDFVLPNISDRDY